MLSMGYLGEFLVQRGRASATCGSSAPASPSSPGRATSSPARARSRRCATRAARASSTATSGPRTQTGERKVVGQRHAGAAASVTDARSRAAARPVRDRRHRPLALRQGAGRERDGRSASRPPKRAIDDCGVARDAVDGVLCLMPAQMGEQHGWASRVAAFLGITPSFCATMDMGGATADRHDADRGHGASRPASARSCCAPSARRPTRRASSRSSSARRGPSRTATSARSPSWATSRAGRCTSTASRAVDYGHIAVTWRRTPRTTRRADAEADDARGPPGVALRERAAAALRLLPLHRRRRRLRRHQRRAGARPAADAGADRGPRAGALVRDHPPVGRRARRRQRGGRAGLSGWPAARRTTSTSPSSTTPSRRASCTTSSHYGFADWDEVATAGRVRRAHAWAAGCRATRPAACSPRDISPA